MLGLQQGRPCAHAARPGATPTGEMPLAARSDPGDLSLRLCLGRDRMVTWLRMRVPTRPVGTRQPRSQPQPPAPPARAGEEAGASCRVPPGSAPQQRPTPVCSRFVAVLGQQCGHGVNKSPQTEAKLTSVGLEPVVRPRAAAWLPGSVLLTPGGLQAQPLKPAAGRCAEAPTRLPAGQWP